MASIHKYIRWLRIISIVFVAFVFGEICTRWFLSAYFWSSAGSSGESYLKGCYAFDGNWFNELAHMSFIQKLAGFLIDGLALGILCAGIFAFHRLMEQLKTGAFFTSDSVHLFNTLGKLALSWTLYYPLRTTLLSLITSLHKGSGNRIISFEFGIKDMVNIFIFVCIILITALMHEGLKLKKEQDLTI